MDKLLTLRAKLRQIYALYDYYFIPALKFAAALSVLLMVNSTVGYMALLSRWTVIVIIALVCALLPWKAITAVIGLYTVLQLADLSWEAAAVATAFVILMVIAHFLFMPGCSMAIVLVPLAYVLKLPYLVPIIVGLVGGAASFIPVGFGVFTYYFLKCVQRNANVLSSTAVDANSLSRFTVLLDALKGNKLMLLSILAFCIVTIIVYSLAKLSFDYAPTIAITAGGVVNMLVFLLGGFSLNITVPYMGVILGTLFSLAIAIAVQFYLLAVDYSRTEFLHYEDDDYVYYVKAVPKIKITEQHLRVQEINSRDSDEAEEREIEQAMNLLHSIEQEDAVERKKPEPKDIDARTSTGPIMDDYAEGD
jgi:hypothetical protein